MSEKFHPERFGLVTASRCSPLVPKKDAKAGMISLAKELAKEKYFNFYDEINTWQMEHGTLGEEFAFKHYQMYIDSTIEKGRWIKDGETGCTTDAESSINKYGIDFKCPCTMEKWLSYLYDGIDSDQYNQCQLSMRLTGFDTWKIGAFLIETTRMSDDGIVYPIEQEQRMIVIDVARNQEWNKKFDANLPELIISRDEFYSILKNKFDAKN